MNGLSLLLNRAVLALVVLVACSAPAVAQEVVEYIHTDALGSPVAITDANGQVIERTVYEPYGAVVNRPLADGPGYTGHVTDSETGLSYMQQRYYDFETSTFLGADPVAADSDGTSFNRYRYASANPYKFKDPDGRADMNVFGEADPNGLRAAGDALNIPGKFTVAGHANNTVIQDQRGGRMENYSVVSSWDMARTQFGLKQGQEILMAGCHLGAEIGKARAFAQGWANLNKSSVYAPNGFVRYPKNYKPGDDMTLRVSLGENGTGGAGVWQKFSPGGAGPTGPAIRSITIKADGAISYQFAEPELGSRIRRIETVKVKQ
ncbi:TPA: RHS domain-containing protein [Stenotrophomonas maltophilia]|nr:RHS domain-containing protein [Stenotrophomonas maltophilia]